MAGPLAGLTFLNTREAGAAPALTGLLEAAGGAVIERPTIAFVPPADWGPFDRALDALVAGQWVIFSSATAVRFTLMRLEALGRGPQALAGARLAAVGPATAEALRAAGLAPALVPERFQAEHLLAALGPHLQQGERVWQPRAEHARPVLERGLAEAGVDLVVTPVYRSVVPSGGLGPALDALRAGRIDWLVFTSGSTARHLLEMVPAADRQAVFRPQVACLGRAAAAAAEDAGFRVAVVPERQDLEGLVATIAAHVAAGGLARGEREG